MPSNNSTGDATQVLGAPSSQKQAEGQSYTTTYLCASCTYAKEGGKISATSVELFPFPKRLVGIGERTTRPVCAPIGPRALY